MTLGLVFVGVFLAAHRLTGRLRDYALAERLVDVPNTRSSHTVATPRGGGLAIALTMLSALPILGVMGEVEWRQVCGLIGGGALVAGIGFGDDHGHAAPTWRLVGHFLAAAWTLVWLGGLPPLLAFGLEFDLGWPGNVIAALYLVWLLNLTNFMDGIDGLASVEAIIVSLGGVVLYFVSTPGHSPWAVSMLLAISTLGFLPWNWTPARVFMGDAGSGFLGLMLAALSLQAAWVLPQLLWAWIILLGVFVVDTTTTLLRRMVRGDRVYEAHRMHAYQHAAQQWGAHRRVTLIVGAINLCWLLPIAVMVACMSLDGITGTLIAYAPLVAAAFWLQAGTPVPE